MSVRLVGIGVLLASLGYSLPGQADCLDDFARSVARDVKRRQCWPRPFVCPDRQAAREPFAIITGNGWEQQNLVGDLHFEGATGQLSEAGRIKVLWVLNEAPEQHRIVYVRRAINPEETAARMASVMDVVAKNTTPGQPPAQVLESNKSVEGWPADRIDAVGQKFQQATPDPKLPAPQNGGNGGGGGSSK
jgi:hypothetical protein